MRFLEGARALLGQGTEPEALRKPPVSAGVGPWDSGGRNERESGAHMSVPLVAGRGHA